MRRVIWSNDDLDFDDWKPDLEEEYPDCSEDELYRIMLDTNMRYLDDERINLKIQLDTPILLIAQLGLWNGMATGYREIESGNIADCLDYFHDYATFYLDDLGDLRCIDYHHDGCNHYLYRAWKPGVTAAQKDSLLNKIYEGHATRADITRYTRRLGDEIARVYGWSFRGMKKTA